ncbi:MAG: sugar nucleotide-binding protein, partial [Gammaproteobacteria bacterium]
GAPTWAHQIAATTVSVLDSLGPSPAETVSDRAGLYHMTAGGQTSWCGFTRAIADRIAARGARTAEVHPIRAEEYQSRATRPLNSVLSNRKLKSTFGVALDPWDAALSACLASADAESLLDTATRNSVERGHA